MARYTLEAGREIYRDGKPYFFISYNSTTVENRCAHGIELDGMLPAMVEWLNKRDKATPGGSARIVCRRIDFKPGMTVKARDDERPMEVVNLWSVKQRGKLIGYIVQTPAGYLSNCLRTLTSSRIHGAHHPQGWNGIRRILINYIVTGKD